MASGNQTLDMESLPRESALQELLTRLAGLKQGQAVDVLTSHDPALLLRGVLDRFPLGFNMSPLHGGPGQWRVHICRRDHRSGRGVTEYLSWDHDRLDALLEAAMDHVRRGQWVPAAALSRDFSHGLLRHIRIEEEILFPSFEQATGMRDGGPTAVMRQEHIDIQQHLHGMLQAVNARDIDAAYQCRADLLGVLVAHNMKEESILYPATDRLHADDSLDRLLERLLLG